MEFGVPISQEFSMQIKCCLQMVYARGQGTESELQ